MFHAVIDIVDPSRRNMPPNVLATSTMQHRASPFHHARGNLGQDAVIVSIMFWFDCLRFCNLLKSV